MRSIRSWLHQLPQTCLYAATAASVLPVAAYAQSSDGNTSVAAADASGEQKPTNPAPTVVDDVQRGLRMRIDLGGRYNAIGSASPPIRLEADEAQATDLNDDLDASGTVILGWDRPAGLPIGGEIFADGLFDLNPDQVPLVAGNTKLNTLIQNATVSLNGIDPTISYFADDQNFTPKFRLYSAFIALSPSRTDPAALQPYKVTLGRQTENVESPITYDGAAVSAKFGEGKNRFGVRVWGGLDAPQRLADDTFSRVDSLAYKETYDTVNFSATGGPSIVREANVQPLFNLVGGASLEASFGGIQAYARHNFIAAQRTTIGGSYTIDNRAGSMRFAGDLRASDFIPRSARASFDFLSMDGGTRADIIAHVQFLQDVTSFDNTFRGFGQNAEFNAATANTIETFRQRDGIRHLNIGPAQPHFLLVADAEQALNNTFSVLARARIRQHFDATQLDYFRSNVYEATAGIAWSGGLGFDAGLELSGGLLDTGLGILDQNKHKDDSLNLNFTGEGVASFGEGRLYTRTTLLDGRMSNLTELFIRRQDLVTRAIFSTGQWSGAMATTVRYDILNFWSVALRVDADVLAPFEAVSGSGYVSALASTSVKF